MSGPGYVRSQSHARRHERARRRCARRRVGSRRRRDASSPAGSRDRPGMLHLGVHDLRLALASRQRRPRFGLVLGSGVLRASGFPSKPAPDRSRADADSACGAGAGCSGCEEEHEIVGQRGRQLRGSSGHASDFVREALVRSFFPCDLLRSAASAALTDASPPRAGTHVDIVVNRHDVLRHRNLTAANRPTKQA
jgi:hypothetical protein